MYPISDWKKERLPVIPIKDERVNFFAKYGVEMAAVAGCALSWRTLKLPAAEGILDGLDAHGLLRSDVNYAEASSGRMAEMYLARAKSRGLRRDQFTFLIRDDVPGAKKGIVRFGGADRIEPGRKSNAIQLARDMGGGGWNGKGWNIGANSTVNPDQYATPYAYTHYEGWASENIVEQFGEFDDIVVPVGTGSTMIGLRRGLHARLEKKPNIIGAMCADGVEVPGMRDEKKMAFVRHPWREAADAIIKVSRSPSFLTAPWISWEIDSNAAPSGGAAYVATCLYLEQLRRKDAKLLHDRRVLFVIHDEASQYVGDRMDEFPMEAFYLPTATLPEELIFGGGK